MIKSRILAGATPSHKSYTQLTRAALPHLYLCILHVTGSLVPNLSLARSAELWTGEQLNLSDGPTARP